MRGARSRAELDELVARLRGRQPREQVQRRQPRRRVVVPERAHERLDAAARDDLGERGVESRSRLIRETPVATLYASFELARRT